MEPDDAATLLFSLVAHRSLRELSLLDIDADDEEPPQQFWRMRAALHELVVANATALQSLELGICEFVEEAHLTPFRDEVRDTLAAALAQNTHLTSVWCCGVRLRGP